MDGLRGNTCTVRKPGVWVLMVPHSHVESPAVLGPPRPSGIGTNLWDDAPIPARFESMADGHRAWMRKAPDTACRRESVVTGRRAPHGPVTTRWPGGSP